MDILYPCCASLDVHKDTVVATVCRLQPRQRSPGLQTRTFDTHTTALLQRRLAPRTIRTYRRWVTEFLRFHHDRTGRWIHPQEMGEGKWKLF